MPPRTLGLLLKSRSAWAVGSSWAFRPGERRSALTPIPTASAACFARGWRSAAKPGRRSAKRPVVFFRRGRTTGRLRIAWSSASGDFEIVSWMKGRETSAKAPNVVSRSTKSWPCCWATGATSAAAAESPRTKPWRSVSDEARFRITGSRFSTSGRRSPIAAFRLCAAPGEDVAELGQVHLDRLAGRVVEGIEDLVDLDRLGGRLGDRDRRRRRRSPLGLRRA